jgi:low affinity Fe/Cu permease
VSGNLLDSGLPNLTKPTLGSRFALLADVITEKSGSPRAFAMAVTLVLIWLISGPLLFYSHTWRLVINTATSIVTFLMVFLIQKTQSRDSRALHLKLNELLAAVEGASNRLINAEDKGEEVLSDIHRRFQVLADVCERGAATGSRSVEDIARDEDGLASPALSRAELND